MTSRIENQRCIRRRQYCSKKLLSYTLYGYTLSHSTKSSIYGHYFERAIIRSSNHTIHWQDIISPRWPLPCYHYNFYGVLMLIDCVSSIRERIYQYNMNVLVFVSRYVYLELHTTILTSTYRYRTTYIPCFICDVIYNIICIKYNS